MPKVSVIMSVYNESPSLLIRSIESILDQKYNDYEFLIANDGSSDIRVESVLNRYKTNSAIKIYSHENIGLTKSLNKLIALSSGEIIARQDSDDISCSDRLTVQIDFMEKNLDICLVGSSYYVIDRDKRYLKTINLPILSEDIRSMLNSNNPFCHGSVCFYKSIAMEIGGYREELRFAQDYDFFWRLAERSGTFNISQPLYALTLHPNSITAKRGRERYKTKLIIQELAHMRKKNLNDEFWKAKQKIDLLFNETKAKNSMMLNNAERLMLLRQSKSILLYWDNLILHPIKIKAWFYLLRCMFILFFVKPLKVDDICSQLKNK